MITLGSSVSIKNLKNAQQHILDVNHERWINDVLFSFNWWFLVAISIIFILVWLKLFDKSRVMEILLAGLPIAILAMLLDSIGSMLNFWTYGYKIIQVMPVLIPVDIIILPVSYMLIYQWVPKWKPYIVTLIILSAFGAFVAEPIFSWMKIYTPSTWTYIYSFPIYIAMGIGVKALVHKLMSMQKSIESK